MVIPAQRWGYFVNAELRCSYCVRRTAGPQQENDSVLPRDVSLNRFHLRDGFFDHFVEKDSRAHAEDP